MNLRRGLFRAWITFSAAWSLFFFYIGLELAPEWASEHGCIRFAFPCSLPFWADRFVVILMPWLLTGAAMLVRWVIRGFGSN
jgi:hypothetical protein